MNQISIHYVNASEIRKKAISGVICAENGILPGIGLMRRHSGNGLWNTIWHTRQNGVTAICWI